MKLKHYTVCQHAGRFQWHLKKPGQVAPLVFYELRYWESERGFTAYRCERFTPGGHVRRYAVNDRQVAILKLMLLPSEIAACMAVSIRE